MGTYPRQLAWPTAITRRLHTNEAATNEREFAEDVQPHLTTMLRLARRLGRNDAEDIVQDALTRAWTKRAQFDPQRGSFRTWLLAITADQAYKTWRWHLRHSKPLSVRPDDGGPRSDDLVDLERSIQRLPRRQRLAVDCFYFAGLSIEECAAAMGCAEGTVKSTLSDARAALRDLLR